MTPPLRRGANVALTQEIPTLTGVVLGVRWNAGAEQALRLEPEFGVLGEQQAGERRGGLDGGLPGGGGQAAGRHLPLLLLTHNNYTIFYEETQAILKQK